MECISLDSVHKTHLGIGKKAKYSERIREKGDESGRKWGRLGGGGGNSRRVRRYLFEFMTVTWSLGTWGGRRNETERERERSKKR